MTLRGSEPLSGPKCSQSLLPPPRRLGATKPTCDHGHKKTNETKSATGTQQYTEGVTPTTNGVQARNAKVVQDKVSHQQVGGKATYDGDQGGVNGSAGCWLRSSLSKTGLVLRGRLLSPRPRGRRGPAPPKHQNSLRDTPGAGPGPRGAGTQGTRQSCTLHGGWVRRPRASCKQDRPSGSEWNVQSV